MSSSSQQWNRLDRFRYNGNPSNVTNIAPQPSISNQAQVRSARESVVPRNSGVDAFGFRHNLGSVHDPHTVVTSSSSIYDDDEVEDLLQDVGDQVGEEIPGQWREEWRVTPIQQQQISGRAYNRMSLDPLSPSPSRIYHHQQQQQFQQQQQSPYRLPSIPPISQPRFDSMSYTAPQTQRPTPSRPSPMVNRSSASQFRPVDSSFVQPLRPVAQLPFDQVNQRTTVQSQQTKQPLAPRVTASHSQPKRANSTEEYFGADDQEFEQQLMVDDQALLAGASTSVKQGFRSAPIQQYGFGGHNAGHASSRPDQVLKGVEPRGNARGTRLRPVSDLPDIYRGLWKFAVFNAVQSTCFDALYNSDQNVVVAAPTSSGKTVLFELAILRLFSNSNTDDTKVVYMAPTKSLCAERASDWKAKFERSGLGWTVAELTGDTATDGPGLWAEVNKARVIVTTPEKWDSITRKWHDHHRSLALLRLFCIDEVHSVGMDVRGATLEVVVSRMKTLGTQTRFIALSATVPNAQDVAAWLHHDDGSSAKTFNFGEEYRPCKLQKIVVGYPPRDNDFSFDSALDYKVFELIQNYSSGKPVLVFSNTRKGCVKLAEQLAKEYRQIVDVPNRRKDLPCPKPPRTTQRVSDKKLAGLLECGIAYHHAGLAMEERQLIERLFISGSISVVCSTSTLAVGVNLPARMVIVKGTKQFREGRMFEFSDTEILQMLGRAGRPQFDTTGVACIMTQKEQVRHYEALANSEATLESCLHKNLTEHINSEIMLRTISSVASALTWLHSTFLYVRISKNPSHYALAKAPHKSADARLEEICVEAVNDLAKNGIVEEKGQQINATAYCEMMAKFYLSQPTFVTLKNMPLKASMRTLLEVMSKAGEFSSIRLRAGAEKTMLTKANKMIRYPASKIVSSADKIFVLIQVVLEGISSELKTADVSNPLSEESLIFPHALRISKCMVDLALEGRDGGIKTALELMRAISARAWDNSPASLRQLEGVGEKYSQALSEKGVKTISDLRSTDPGRIELIANRHPPFGRKVLAQARSFPQFTIKLEAEEEEVVETGVKVYTHVEIGLKATQPPPIVKRNGALLSAMVTLVTSDAEYIEFRKLRLDKLLATKQQSFSVSVILVKPSQRIIASVAVDGIAGSEVKVVLKPSTNASEYPVPTLAPSSDGAVEAQQITLAEDALHDPDQDFVDAEAEAIEDEINADEDGDDRHEVEEPKQAPQSRLKPSKALVKPQISKPAPAPAKPRRPDGKYECNHNCGDKTKCRHLCCREGLDKPPKVTRKKSKTDVRHEEPVRAPVQRKRSSTASTKKLAPVKADSNSSTLAEKDTTKKDTLLDFFPSSNPKSKKRKVIEQDSDFDSDSSDLLPLDEILKTASAYDAQPPKKRLASAAKIAIPRDPDVAKPKIVATSKAKKSAPTRLVNPSSSSSVDGDNGPSSPPVFKSAPRIKSNLRIPRKKLQQWQEAQKVEGDEIDELADDSDLDDPSAIVTERVRPGRILSPDNEHNSSPSKYFKDDNVSQTKATARVMKPDVNAQESHREDDTDSVSSTPPPRYSPIFLPPSTSPRVPDDEVLPSPDSDVPSKVIEDDELQIIPNDGQAATSDMKSDLGKDDDDSDDDHGMEEWLRRNVRIIPS